MRLELAPGFIDIYIERYSNNHKIQKIFDKRTQIFSRNSKNPILKDHKLTGKLEGFRSFSITKDVRVIYFIDENTAYFVDIGTHNQVYS